jgi:hypothetical protein
MSIDVTLLKLCVTVAVLAHCTAALAADATSPDYALSWQKSGRLEAYTSYDDPSGKIGVLLADGTVIIKNHPFFRPTGPAGRSCSTCHVPENAMGLSAESLQARWKESGESDPVFAAIDGANCPNVPAGKATSHSLLLNRGVFRISLPWPPRDAQGKPIQPEFEIEVLRDPTGCNTDAQYGLNSKDPHVSVYRRPRITANLKYILNANSYRYGFNVKTGFAQPQDPEGQGVASMNLMADARFLSLGEQHGGAIKDHMPGAPRLSKEDLNKLVKFTSQIYTAQVEDKIGSSLIEPGGPAGLGPYNLMKADVGFSGEAIDTPVFQRFDQWRADPDATGTSDAAKFRASVARGQDIFITRTFLVRDVAGINTLGVGNPAKRACALCHNAQMTGHDLAPGWMNIGTTTWPWANDNLDLPLFKLTCRQDVPAHPYLGRVIYTNDPGRALVSGRCSEIGMITMQQFRGLAARAPYFSNGSAKTLREVVDFYDRRFQIGYTEQEKQDLVNFLSVL